MNLRFVQTLREVGEHGSFSAAAAALHFTQPAVSRQVAQLEREVGMPLVVRSRQGVSLTAAGRLVVEHAEAIRGQLLQLETSLTELSGGARLTVGIGGFPSAFIGMIPELVRGLRARVPGAEVTLKRCSHDEALSLLRTAELDFALVFARPELSQRLTGIEIAELGEEPMLVLLPRDHRLARKAKVRLADLAKEQWIVGAPDPSSSIIVNACIAAGFDPNVIFETDDPLATQSLIAAGLGVSLSSPWASVALRDDVVLKPLAPPAPTRRVRALVADPPGPGARILLDLAAGLVGAASGS
ncbi:MAG: LysR family transcriptional regulator [Gaiellaceae bacterium]|jgi:DNA-binding transcriptional LysR family regulator